MIKVKATQIKKKVSESASDENAALADHGNERADQ